MTDKGHHHHQYIDGHYNCCTTVLWSLFSILCVVSYYPYYNLRHNTWAPFMSSGFQVSYVIRLAMKNLHNLLHIILLTSRLEITQTDPFSRCLRWIRHWIGYDKMAIIRGVQCTPALIYFYNLSICQQTSAESESEIQKIPDIMIVSGHRLIISSNINKTEPGYFPLYNVFKQKCLSKIIIKHYY